MTEPSTSVFDQAQTLQILSDEVTGCDRCYQKYYNILQNKSHLFDSRRKRLKSAKAYLKSEFTIHPLYKNSDLTGGGLIEPGTLGRSIFDLSAAVSKASTLSPKRKAQQLEQSYKNIHLCELNLENVKKELLELLTKKVELRIDGIINGVSAEGKKIEGSIKDKFRIKKDELNERCRLQMEGLRRQLEADIDFEEKNSKILIERAKEERLKQIDDQLAELGCTGEEFLVNGPKIEVLESEIVEVEAPTFKGQVVLPLNQKVDEKIRDLERKELQNFCLYARAPARVGRKAKQKTAEIKIALIAKCTKKKKVASKPVTKKKKPYKSPAKSGLSAPSASVTAPVPSQSQSSSNQGPACSAENSAPQPAEPVHSAEPAEPEKPEIEKTLVATLREKKVGKGGNEEANDEGDENKSKESCETLDATQQHSRVRSAKTQDTASKK